MAATPIPILKVARILDNKTLVITGTGIDQLAEGSSLAVVATGPPLEEAGGVPIIVAKAHIEVTANAGEYVLASPPLRTEEEHNSWSLMLRAGTAVKVQRRPAMPVEEQQIIGNPAGRPIAVGDVVIRWSDLREYVGQLRAGGAKPAG